MKKVLLASTVLVAFGAVSAQAAEPIKLGLGGYIVENLGYAENNKFNANSAPASVHKVQFWNQDDVTISFMGSTKLDNGISVGVNVDYYATQSPQGRSINGGCGATNALTGAVTTSASCKGNSQLKRSYATVSTAFGTLILGEREDATYIVHNSAPDVSPLGPVGDGYWYWWVVSPANHRALSLDNDSRYDDRGNKISFVTPAWNGLAAAFSYVPSISLSANSGPVAVPASLDSANVTGKGYINGTDFGGDAFGGGLAYSNTFGALSVKADATVVQANIANLTIYQGGLNLGYGGWTVGGSLLNRDVGSNESVNGVYNTTVAQTLSGYGTPAQLANTTAAVLAQTAAFAGNAMTAGISYTTGPLAFSGAYFHDNSKSLAAFNGTGKADSTEVYQFGAAYTAGPGVIFRGGVTYVDYKGSQLNAATPYLNNNDGIAVVTGLKLSF